MPRTSDEGRQQELHGHGCKLVTVADGFDLDGFAGEIIMCVMAWAAKMERLAINERIAAARERVEAEGRRWGRPRRLDAAQVERAALLRRGRPKPERDREGVGCSEEHCSARSKFV